MKLYDIPNEILDLIFGYLDIVGTNTIRKVCVKFYCIIFNNPQRDLKLLYFNNIWYSKYHQDLAKLNNELQEVINLINKSISSGILHKKIIKYCLNTDKSDLLQSIHNKHTNLKIQEEYMYKMCTCGAFYRDTEKLELLVKIFGNETISILSPIIRSELNNYLNDYPLKVVQKFRRNLVAPDEIEDVKQPLKYKKFIQFLRKNNMLNDSNMIELLWDVSHICQVNSSINYNPKDDEELNENMFYDLPHDFSRISNNNTPDEYGHMIIG